MDDSQQELVAQFCAITSASASAAQTALSAADWDISAAVSLYYAASDGSSSQDESATTSVPTSSAPAPAPQPAASSSNTRRTQPSSRLRTLRDLQASANDEDDEEEKDQDMFAGGEKSGLAVQNPNSAGSSGPTDHFRNILNQARQNRDRPTAQAEEDEVPRHSNFSGRAQTLGGDDAPSRVVNDPQSGTRRAPLERINRTLHLWTDGVSVDDGPLFRFDDPNNAHIMQQINRGQAPLSLLDVQPDQEVDLTLEPHKDQAYVQPKEKYKAFGGQGQRLGSPVPGPAATTTQAAAPAPSAQSTSTSSTPPTVQIDESQPVIQIQIRLGDGSRLTSRFNSTHTVGDVYGYVDQASSTGRAYALMTTFPSTELKDRAQALGDISGFKRGGVLVQKYT